MHSGVAPLTSVIIPTYNAGRFITLTVDSVLQQTLPDLELIVIDDGSADDTLEKVRAYRDGRIHIIEQPHQGGPVALNAGLNIARGEYVAFLDHDDIWLPNKLERHAKFLQQHSEVDLTFSWIRWIDGEGKDTGLRSRRWTGPISFRQLLVDFVIGTTSSVVFRRSAIDRAGWFDPRLPRCWDSDLCFRVSLLRPGNAHAIPEELTLYRRHTGQQSRDWQAMKQERGQLLEKLRLLAPELVSLVMARSVSNMHRYWAFLAYEQCRFPEACHLLWQGFLCTPSGFVMEVRNWKLGAACLAGWVLPNRLHRSLERLAGFRR